MPGRAAIPSEANKASPGRGNGRLSQGAKALEGRLSSTDIAVNLLVLVLSSFLGLELIRHVSRLLHTPLMSLTNAISAVSIVAALIFLAHPDNAFVLVILATVAVALASSNAIGGFIITERILRMFGKRPPQQPKS